MRLFQKPKELVASAVANVSAAAEQVIREPENDNKHKNRSSNGFQSASDATFLLGARSSTLLCR
jgi:hypothetical protein